MKKTYTVLLVTVMCLSALLLWTGEVINAESKPFEGETITVVAHSGNQSKPWLGEVEAIKEKLGIILNVVSISPDEMYSRELLELTQGTGAYDIIQYNSAWIGDFDPYILPLDEYVEKDGDQIGFKDILPAFNKGQNLWGGKVSISLDGDTFLLYYRNDLFQDAGEKAAFKEKYGYELPAPPKTWPQVVDLAQFFTRKKGEKLAGRTLQKDFYGYADQAKRGRVYYWYLFRFAPFNAPKPHYFDPNTMEPKINTQEAVAALENMKTLLEYSPPGVLSYEWDELYNDGFVGGTLAMFIHWCDEGRWAADAAPLAVDNPPAADLGIAPTPGVEKDGTYYQYTIIDSAWVASISKDSKNPDAAYAVLKHLLSPGPTNLKYVIAGIGWDPSKYSHFNSQEWREGTPGIEKYLNTELKALENGYPMLKIPGAFEYMDILDLNISKYLAGEIATAKEALDNTAAKWVELNNKFGVEKQKAFYGKIW